MRLRMGHVVHCRFEPGRLEPQASFGVQPTTKRPAVWFSKRTTRRSIHGCNEGEVPESTVQESVNSRGDVVTARVQVNDDKKELVWIQPNEDTRLCCFCTHSITVIIQSAEHNHSTCSGLFQSCKIPRCF